MLSKIAIGVGVTAIVCGWLWCNLETAAEEGGAGRPARHGLVLGTKTFPLPAPPRPEKGQRVIDPVFSTSFVRITDKTSDGYADQGIINEHARSDPENADGSLVILRGLSNRWYIYRTRDFKRLRVIRNPAGQPMEPRWDARDPKLFYFVADMKLCAHNVETGQSSVLRDFKVDFPGGAVITSRSEGDASTDRRFFCWQVQDSSWETTDVFVYDRMTNRIAGRKPMRTRVNGASMSMSGKHCLVAFDAEPLRAYRRDLASDVVLPPGIGHHDLAITSDGRDVAVYQNNKTDFIAMADLDAARETALLHIPFNVNPAIGIHISGNASMKMPGWVLVSTNGPKNPPAGKKRSWMDLQLFMLELKARPRIWRVAATHSVNQIDFSAKGQRQHEAEAFATVNARGNRIYWGSNWENRELARIDTYMAILPDNWPSLLGR